MLDSPHTSAPMLMRGNALVLKTPVENAPRTSIEKHLSWSSDIPPAARFPLHRSRPAEYQPNRQPATVCAESGAGEARRRVGRRRGRLTSGARQSLRALVMQSSAHPGHSPHGTVRWATEDSISQCPFLQMTYTAETPHAEIAPRPEHAHATDRPATATFPPRPAHTTIGWRQDRRPVVSKRPLHSRAAAKMSPHIRIGPEPVLAAHARSPPAAGSHRPAGADSALHSEQNFFSLPLVDSRRPIKETS
jgi:hypothetical protein